jgi:small subunit ribosomal protein S3Ae
VAKGSKKRAKVRDKWRDKQWIVVNSPSSFGSTPLNYIPITDPTQAIGRVIENTMFDYMKQDLSQHQIKVYMQIEKISDGVATTTFKGHEYAREFLRSLIRRGSSMITFISDYTTNDGFTFRVSTIMFSHGRVNSSKKHSLRLASHRILSKRIPELTLDQFAQEVTMGKVAADILAETKKITPIRHVGIKKTKLLSTAQSRAVQEAKPVAEAQKVSAVPQQP